MPWFSKKSKQIEAVPPEERVVKTENVFVKCDGCEAHLYKRELEESHQVCSHCGFHFRIGARERLEMLFDDGKFEELDAEVTSIDPLEFVDTKPYSERLESAKSSSGLPEAVLNGRGKVGDHRYVRRDPHPELRAIDRRRRIAQRRAERAGRKVAEDHVAGIWRDVEQRSGGNVTDRPARLRHAAEESKDHLRLVRAQPAHQPHLSERLLLREIAHTARVEQDDVRLSFTGRQFIPARYEVARDLFGVALVHLATISLDEEFRHRGWKRYTLDSPSLQIQFH